MHRNEAMKAIKTALQRRSGKAWSVTGGKGTAWGWITIDAPPARRTCHAQLKANAKTTWPADYEEVVTDQPGGHMTPADRAELAKLLGKETIHFQGESIPASSDYYHEYVERAQGKTPTVTGKQYWD